MFLTTAEASWIGIAVGALFTSVNGWIALHGTRRKEHRQRVWDRTVDVYSKVLLMAEGWSVVRQNMMRGFNTDGPVPTVPKVDPEELQHAQVLLDMIGDLRVRNALQSAADAHSAWGDKKRWVIEVQKRNTDDHSLSSSGRDAAATETLSLVEESKTARAAADKRYRELRSAIREVLSEAP